MMRITIGSIRGVDLINYKVKDYKNEKDTQWVYSEYLGKIKL